MEKKKQKTKPAMVFIVICELEKGCEYSISLTKETQFLKNLSLRPTGIEGERKREMKALSCRFQKKNPNMHAQIYSKPTYQKTSADLINNGLFAL